MNRLVIYALIVIAIFGAGYGLGHHAKTVSDNAAVVKQVVQASKTEAKNEAQVEKQNDDDRIKIRELEAALIAAKRDAGNRGVPKPFKPGCVPQTKGDAGAREAAGADIESAGRYEEAYRTFREELLIRSAVAEQLRLQVLACKAQWPN